MITDKQDYKNFEVVLEMRNDYGPDSGLFLRSNDKGQAFQAMIDSYCSCFGVLARTSIWSTLN